MHQRLNAIVMKAIWNIEKRQGRVTIQELVEEIKEEYRERISYGSEVTNYLFKGGDAYDLEKIHITRMATNQESLLKG